MRFLGKFDRARLRHEGLHGSRDGAREGVLGGNSNWGGERARPVLLSTVYCCIALDGHASTEKRSKSGYQHESRESGKLVHWLVA